MSKPGATLSKLQLAMREKLESARFRFINEQLYTQQGNASFEMMKQDPSLFSAYHTGYRNQVEGWPENPLDRIINELRKDAPPGSVIGDFGCGEARLGATLGAPSGKLVVHSFDLVAANPRVTACNIASVPLKDGVLDFAVFCLSLMGTDYSAFLGEAHRTLKPGGRLLVAEVQSRFNDTQGAPEEVDDAGRAVDTSHKSAHAHGKKGPGKSAGGGAGARAPTTAESSGLSSFIAGVKGLGFELERAPDTRNPMFVLLSFKKRLSAHATHTVPSGATTAAAQTLKRKRPEGETAGNGPVSSKGPKVAKREPLEADSSDDDDHPAGDDDRDDGPEKKGTAPSTSAAASEGEKKKRKRKRRDKKKNLEAFSGPPDAHQTAAAPSKPAAAASFAGPALKPCIYKRR